MGYSGDDCDTCEELRSNISVLVAALRCIADKTHPNGEERQVAYRALGVINS